MISTGYINFEIIHSGARENAGVSVDLSVLAQYESIQLDEEPDLIGELIDLYLEDAPRRFALMKESVARGDWAAVKQEAHSLRGSSGNIGAPVIVNICSEIEGKESGDLPSSIDVLVNCLELELEKVRRIFNTERQRRLK